MTDFPSNLTNAVDIEKLLSVNNFTSTLSGNLNWSNWTNTLSTLQFDRSKTDFSIIHQAVSDYFKPETFSFEVLCSYPISGQYGFLGRLSFYLLLIFALVLRRHLYLSTAALGTAMTYAATTVVHAFSLLVRYHYQLPDFDETATTWVKKGPRYYGDVDMVPMLPILATAAVMLTPILNFSTVVKENEARSIVVWWGALIFAGLLPVAIVNWRGVFPFFVYGQVATCNIGPHGCNSTSLVNTTNDWSKDFYNKCHCRDTCGSITNLTAPFRHDTSIQVYNISDKVNSLQQSESLWWLYTINILVLVFIGGQGVLGLIEIKLHQTQVRAWMFRHIAGLKPKSQRTLFKEKLSYHLGKGVAAGFYIFSILIATICPLVFISSVVVNEIMAWGYPYGETFDAIGQWGFWVSALFVILAAIVQKYNHAWMESIALGFKTTLRLIKCIFGKDTLRSMPKKEERNKHNSAVENTKAFFTQLAKPFNYIRFTFAAFWDAIRKTWVDFRDWWKDPINHPAQKQSLPIYKIREEFMKEAKHVKRALTHHHEVETSDSSAQALDHHEQTTAHVEDLPPTPPTNTHTIQDSHDRLTQDPHQQRSQISGHTESTDSSSPENNHTNGSPDINTSQAVGQHHSEHLDNPEQSAEAKPAVPRRSSDRPTGPNIATTQGEGMDHANTPGNRGSIRDWGLYEQHRSEL
ncbi:uncharacterized protein KY384_000147 [Bacidia gigantensis]|uniref:uncharacterized protein n=1 Tax=Bacidia gigantensis TaxID=2732470 RepID=UPI001D038C4A|nr:uncharacterized protein KY384_000147 [Bacidia gigantensis]KAG8526154.1 hypothetical protein KY384_000147 [Bacidia gigantensis]